MQLKSKILTSLFIGFIIFIFTQSEAFARKRLLPGRGDGMASIDVTAKSLNDVGLAVKAVFGEDGYNLRSERGGQLKFSRPASRMKDFSYGGLASRGVYEQVSIGIADNGGGRYTIECNVYITDGNQNPTDIDTKVLKLFGREYLRMLRRVRRRID